MMSDVMLQLPNQDSQAEGTASSSLVQSHAFLNQVLERASATELKHSVARQSWLETAIKYCFFHICLGQPYGTGRGEGHWKLCAEELIPGSAKPIKLYAFRRMLLIDSSNTVESL